MAQLISCKDISKSFTSAYLFESLNLVVGDSERLGIIGPNGSGKSTLLKILSGVESPDDGEVARQKHLRLSYVSQSKAYPAEWSVLEAAREAAEAKHFSSDEANVVAQTYLSKMGFQDFDTKIHTLSGGWQKRLSISCGLLGEPDLVLFDEPTNHLDLAGILWLENLLSTAPFAWVLVSHDRYFLEKTVRKVVEVNKVYEGCIFSTSGSYADFLERRQEHHVAQGKLAQSLSNKVKKEVAWLRAGVKARTTKSKSRIDEAHKLIGELNTTKQRMQSSEAGIEFKGSDRKTKKLCELIKVSKTIEQKKLFSDLTLTLGPGMRLGLLGPNGSGKTTLLKTIAGHSEPNSGTVRLAQDLKCLFFDQHKEQLDPEWTLQRALSDTGDTVNYLGRPIHVASWAKRFKFSHDQLNQKVKDLSGGEKARLLIARLILLPADILLLDEPTNDLDIPTLEVLEESLLDFPGAMVIISHDRYLLNRVCTGFVGLDGHGTSLQYADYDQWQRVFVNSHPDRKSSATSKDKKKPSSRAGNQQKRLSYIEQREYDQMDDKILAAETSLEVLKEKSEDPDVVSDPQKAKEAFDKLAHANEVVENLYARWAELESKLT